MGNVLSCVDRWGKRVPDGALLDDEIAGQNTQPSPLLQKAKKSDLDGEKTSTETANVDGPKAAPAASRSARRRPTYSAAQKTKKLEEETDEEEENEDKAQSMTDLRETRIEEYRKNLTKTVKLKTSIFQMTAQVTLSADGISLIWFSGKDVSKGKKPIGDINIDTIFTIKAKADNSKVVDITTKGGESYSFQFQTDDERNQWQKTLESYKSFRGMA